MPGGEVRLRRSVGTRLGGGWALQPLLSLIMFFEVIIVGVGTYFAGPHLLIGALPAVPIALLWLVGVTAGARADSLGVSWRVFVRHTHPWSSVQAVELGRSRAKRLRLGVPAIFVTADGSRQLISSALDVGDRRLTDFVEGLTTLARAAGVRIEVDPSDVYWRELLAGDLLR